VPGVHGSLLAASPASTPASSLVTVPPHALTIKRKTKRFMARD
jgi:hypothetical protein